MLRDINAGLKKKKKLSEDPPTFNSRIPAAMTPALDSSKIGTTYSPIIFPPLFPSQVAQIDIHCPTSAISSYLSPS
jgi:hypothetical protein